jgi:hypothetical protein
LKKIIYELYSLMVHITQQIETTGGKVGVAQNQVHCPAVYIIEANISADPSKLLQDKKDGCMSEQSDL